MTQQNENWAQPLEKRQQNLLIIRSRTMKLSPSFLRFLPFLCMILSLLELTKGMCHSSCEADKCTSDNDPSLCTSCSSSVYQFVSTNSPKYCTPNPNSNEANIQVLQYVSKSTVLGDSFLKSATFDSALTEPSDISSFYGLESFMAFDDNTKTTLTLELSGLGEDHHALMLRYNIYTQCLTTATTSVTTDSATHLSAVSLTDSIDTVIETPLLTHTAYTAAIEITFTGSGCTAQVQDITLYVQKCESYCPTCTDGGNLLQSDGLSCASTCANPNEFVLTTGEVLECTVCDTKCTQCSGISTNCTQCANGYYKDPFQNVCGSDCNELEGYFKFQDNTCGQCASGSYGDEVQGGVAECNLNCATGCATCFGGLSTECFTCDGEDGFLKPGTTECVSPCPSGYEGDVSSKTCEPIELCDSSCSSCSTKNDPSSCTSSCSSSQTSLQLSLAADGSCDFSSSDWETVANIDKDTSIASDSILKEVTVNSAIKSAPGSTLQSLGVYIGAVIEFNDFTSDTLIFQLRNLGADHYKIFARVNAYTKCDDLSQNTDVTIELGGSSQTQTLSNSVETIIEVGAIAHTKTSASLSITFGDASEDCSKLLGNILVMVQKCASYCSSCPDGGSVLQFGSTLCLSTCPQGYYISEDNTECLPCSSPCVACAGSASNCTLCGTISNQKYYLNDSDLSNADEGGECVLNCSNGYFEGSGDDDFKCLPCDVGCAECHYQSDNCTACKLDGSNYFLQPGENRCAVNCPDRYFQKSDFTCVECELGYGDTNFGSLQACDQLCNGLCLKCFGSSASECLSCKDSGYLEPQTTNCVTTCPAGYYAEMASSTCEVRKLCHSTCATCGSDSSLLGNQDYCQSCGSTVMTGLTFGTISGAGACIPNVEDSTYSNIEHFMTITPQTTISFSGTETNLKRVTIDGIDYTSSTHGSFANAGSMINYDEFTVSKVTYALKNVGIDHFKVYVRLNTFQQCTGLNQSLILTVAGISKTFTTLPSVTEIHESDLIDHTTTSLTISVEFGSSSECPKLVQDVSVYVQKCASYCLSCPDGGSLLQYGSSVCLTTCPTGYYKNTQETQCYKCSQSCGACSGTASNCTSCGLLSGKTYYLNDSDLADADLGGECVLNCSGGFYEGDENYECLPCDAGCAECHYASDNCTACQEDPNTSTHYYLQPTENSCQTDCPSRYFKSNTHTCVQCTGASYGHWNQLSGTQCSSDCHDNCAECFGPASTTCTACVDQYFLQEGTTICLNSCPTGYDQNSVSNTCEPKDMCHSSCDTCISQANESACATCSSSSLSGLTFAEISGSGQCNPIPSDSTYPNLYLLTTIDSETRLGADYLSYIIKNGQTYSTANTALSSLLYTNSLIDFDTLGSSSSLTLNIVNMGYNHHKVYIRVNTFTSCLNPATDDSFTLSVDGVSAISQTATSTKTTFETGLIDHVSNAMKVVISFGTHGQGCVKYVQDLSIYLQKCEDHCGSCPDEGKLLQFGSSVCLEDCPDGYFPNTQQTNCFKCSEPCKTCENLAIECTSCGQISGISYYLDEQAKLCVENCPSGFYEDTATLKCEQCQSGCAQCEASASNCSECETVSGLPDVHYYLQPDLKTCSADSCPTQYAKTMDYTCVLCANGKYGDGEAGVTAGCQVDTCTEGCATCFATGLTSCFSCNADSGNVNHYLQPEQGSTVCDPLCPDGYYGDSSSFQCQLCSSPCSKCQTAADHCLACAEVNGRQTYLNLTGNVCVSECPSGSYIDGTDNQCKQCTDGCSECTGSGLNACTECEVHPSNSSKYYLVADSSQCIIDDCPQGQYEDDSTMTCHYCHVTCTKCQTSATDCTGCKNQSGIKYYLYNPNDQNECLVVCPSGFYGDNSDNTCKQCDSRCAACSGADNSSCTACQTDDSNVDHFLVIGTTVCSDECLPGTYSNGTSFKCLQCDPNCETCVDNAEKCTSCDLTDFGTKVFLEGNLCVQNCEDGFYEETSGGNVCTVCHAGCATCSGPDPTDCQSCRTDTVPDPDEVYYKDLESDTCGKESCPDGQFILDGTLHVCQLCSPECLTCVESAKKCTDAAACAQNFYFLPTGNSCLETCPDGRYADGTTSTCELCNDGCTLCFGPDLTDCTACQNDGTNDYFKKIGKTECSQTCDGGQYEDPADYLCKYCYSTCGQCLDSSQNCTQCLTVSGVPYFLFNVSSQNQCLQTCPEGYYGDKSTNMCVQCDQRCSLCGGPSNDSCSACKANSTSDKHYLVYQSTICSDVCPDGQYAVDSTFSCQLCDANCEKCVGTAETCTECNLTDFGTRVFLQGNICVQNCEDGYYEQIDDHTCTACHVGCATCTESTLNDCQSCRTDTSTDPDTVYYKQLGATQCAANWCPDGQFIAANIDHICQLCSLQCLKCETTAKTCLDADSCAQFYYFYGENSSCLLTCPDGFYPDNTTDSCEQCHAGCALCTGPTISECSRCQEDTDASTVYHKYSQETICNTTCPDKFYESSATFTCEPCDDECLLCDTGPSDCQSCKNNSGVIFYSHLNSCLQKCPEGYYGDDIDNQCKECFEGCSLCTAGTNRTCSACKNTDSDGTPFYLEYGTTYCSESCPAGEYEVPSLNRCAQCDDNCETCDITATNCTSCYLTATGLKVYLEGEICVQDCQDGQYEDEDSRLCEDCAEGCATCYGPGLDQCYSCETSADGLRNFYKFINQTTCGEETCPIGQYIDALNTRACQECSSECNACETKPNNCIEAQNCSDLYFFYATKNSCLLVCPDGFHKKEYTNEQHGVCEACTDGCEICTDAGLDHCSKCEEFDGTHYFKEILREECVTECDIGEYEVVQDHSCKYCHESCIECDSNALDCQSCKNVSGQTYFYYDSECLLTCPDGFWGNTANNLCEPCHEVCPRCYGPSLIECYECTTLTDPTTKHYYLELGTTVCSEQCPYGEYEVNDTNSCRPCYENCATCDIESTNCTTCSSLATLEILYWYEEKCVLACPTGYWQNSSIENDHHCTLCHEYCSKCTGPTVIECQACKDVTDPDTGITTSYYKDLESTTCADTCPEGQFIADDLSPNVCVPCHSSCVRCETSNINCSKCTFSYYLYVEENFCLEQCPVGLFNDNTLTENNYLCTACTTGCSSCTGSGLNACQTCESVPNPSNASQTINYYKHESQDICATTCTVGYYGNVLNNKCEACDAGCVSCEFNSSNCYECTKVVSTYYYLPLNQNTCMQICPDGSYGNPITYKCEECIYFSYEGTCLLTCPNDTEVNSVTGKTICQNCSTEAGTCNSQYTFELSTKVVNDGDSLEHKVYLPAGLLSSITSADLSDGLTVYLIAQEARRRLLQTTISLDVQGLTISSDGYYVFITTSNNIAGIDLSTAKVQANFKGGVLVSKDGVIYQSTTDEFGLSDPTFMQTYYMTYQIDYSYMTEGIVLCCITFVLLLVTMTILHRKAYHEVMAFIMAIQCIGLIRMRSYPLDITIYTILLGFSQYEFGFIPNWIIEAYPVGYEEKSLESVEFAYGDHNFFNTLGESLEVFFALQIALICFYIYKSDSQPHVQKYKFLQQCLITFFLVKTLFCCFLSIYSLSLNSLTDMKAQFLISQFVALCFFIAYFIYLFIWVRPYTVYELYKVHNVLRVICVLVVVINRYGGIIALDLLEFLFFIADYFFYRNDKINKNLYILDRVLILIALNAAGFLEDTVPTLVVLGVTLYSVFLIKFYYVIKAYIEYREQREKDDMSNLSISDIVHISVKDKGEKLDGDESPDEKALMKSTGRNLKLSSKKNSNPKDSSLIKLHDSSNIIFNDEDENNETKIIDRRPIKAQNRPLNDEQREEIESHNVFESQQSYSQENKRSQNEADSESSGDGEMIVYLDPEDYEKEMRPKKQIHKDSRDKMATDTGFYPSRRNRHKSNMKMQNKVDNLDDIEIIQIEHNKSEEDQEEQKSEQPSEDRWVYNDLLQNGSRNEEGSSEVDSELKFN